VTHACVGSDVQCKITWYPAVPVDRLVAVELREAGHCPGPERSVGRVHGLEIADQDADRPGPTRITLSDLNAGWHKNAIGHITAVGQVWVIAGAAIGWNVLVRPQTRQQTRLERRHGTVHEPRVGTRRHKRAAVS
jgi:hypothetical protein